MQAWSIGDWKSAAAFLDIKKAFDTVWHKRVLYKLFMVNSPDYLLRLTKDFLENKQVRVRINGMISTPQKQRNQPQNCHTSLQNDIQTNNWIRNLLFKTCRRPARNNIEITEWTTLRRLTRLRHPANPNYNPSNQLPLWWNKDSTSPLSTQWPFPKGNK